MAPATQDRGQTAAQRAPPRAAKAAGWEQDRGQTVPQRAPPTRRKSSGWGQRLVCPQGYRRGRIVVRQASRESRSPGAAALRPVARARPILLLGAAPGVGGPSFLRRGTGRPGTRRPTGARRRGLCRAAGPRARGTGRRLPARLAARRRARPRKPRAADAPRSARRTGGRLSPGGDESASRGRAQPALSAEISAGAVLFPAPECRPVLAVGARRPGSGLRRCRAHLRAWLAAAAGRHLAEREPDPAAARNGPAVSC